MKNKFYLVFLFVSVLFFSSCNHYFYTPPEANLLMISEEGELKASAGVGFASLNESTYNVQLAYSPVNRLSVAANFFQIGGFRDPSKTNGDNQDNRVSSSLGEFAVGTYWKKDINTVKEEGTEFESVVNNQVVLDAYAGYGRSRLRRAYSVGDIDFDAHHYFLQGGIHFKSKFLGLSYSLRGVVLDYLDGLVTGNVSDANLIKIRELETSPFTFIESSFRIRAGKEKYKLYLSRNWMSSPFGDKQLEYSSSSWHVGVVLNLNQIFTKEKKKIRL